MKLKSVFVLLLLLSANTFAQDSLDKLLQLYNTRSIPYISAEGLRMLQLNDSVTILDAREKNEFDVSHIASARFIGFNDFSTEEKTITSLDKNKSVIIYCSLGIRSEEIGEKLKKAGFTNVENLYGGIFEWKNKGFPVIDNLNQETEQVHVFSKPWSKWLKKGIPVF